MLRNLLRTATQDVPNPIQSGTRPMDNESRLAQYRAKREIHEITELARVQQSTSRLSGNLQQDG